MATKTVKKKSRHEPRPDDGQGSKGNFGADGDWGKPVRKTEKTTSPVPPKKTDG